MDTISSEHRSWNMSRIRCRDTKPEKVVRSVLHSLGYRFRKNTGERLFGKPDIVLPKHGIVIFVHGCFWHRHPKCRFAYTPKSRCHFWLTKFDANVRRDREVRRRLRREGWRVVVVWECRITRIGELAAKLRRLV